MGQIVARLALPFMLVQLIGSASAQVSPDVAARVFVGRIPCELGVVVSLEADPKQAAQFIMRVDKQTYVLNPVETSTGVIRLEDKKLGAVWLQLANKSMLMNQKLGRRLADECMSPVQASVAQSLKASPVPGLLDAPAPVMARPATGAETLTTKGVAANP